MAEPEESEIRRLIKLIQDYKISPERLKELLGSGLLGSFLLTPLSNIDREKFYEAIGPRLLGYLAITPDFDQTVEQLIADGNYASKNSDINSENFPIAKSQSENNEVVVICFRRQVSSEEVLQTLKKLNLRPAKLIQLLNVGKEYPLYQLECPIVALGSTYKSPAGFLYVPFLFSNNNDRYLDLGFFSKKWMPQCLFLALRS